MKMHFETECRTRHRSASLHESFTRPPVPPPCQSALKALEHPELSEDFAATLEHAEGKAVQTEAVFGLGYVGLTNMCCRASLGHRVLGFDVSEEKVRAVNAGRSPLTEPGIDRLLARGVRAGRIAAFSEIGELLDACSLALVCVGTPSLPDGSHNMAHIAAVTRQIAAHVKADRKSPLTVVYRSTVRPGTMEGLIAPIFHRFLGEGFERVVELVYHPEFLRESTAVSDYFAPPKIVIGTRDGRPSERLMTFNHNLKAPTFHVRYGEAELTKFVDNTWHALKVAYANEIGRVCLQLGLNATKVHEIFVSDTKLNISTYYTRPGGAFGGSCLPKDVRALQSIASESGAGTPVIDALLRSNEAHKYRLFQLATKGLQSGATILLAGLAFKARTDDLRESPNVDLARALLREGYQLDIFDPYIDAAKLLGANLGYAYTQLPTLSGLLVSCETAQSKRYDRVIAANATVRELNLPPNQDVINLEALA